MTKSMNKTELALHCKNARTTYERADLIVSKWNRKLSAAKKRGDTAQTREACKELNLAQQNRTIAGLRLKAAEKKLAALSPSQTSHKTRLSEQDIAQMKQSQARTRTIMRKMQASLRGGTSPMSARAGFHWHLG